MQSLALVSNQQYKMKGLKLGTRDQLRVLSNDPDVQLWESKLTKLHEDGEEQGAEDTENVELAKVSLDLLLCFVLFC